MAKNRKSESTALRFGPAIKAFVLCALIAVPAVGYVWQKGIINHTLGPQIKEREVRLAELQRQNKIRRDQLAILVSPPALEARVKQLNLGLGQPQLSQIVRLVETPPAALEKGKDNPGAEQRLAQLMR